MHWTYRILQVCMYLWVVAAAVFGGLFVKLAFFDHMPVRNLGLSSSIIVGACLWFAFYNYLQLKDLQKQ